MSIISVFSYLYTLVGPGVKNEAYVDEPQLLQRKSSLVKACYIKFSIMQEEATELNQVTYCICMLVIHAIILICMYRMMLKVIMKQLKCLSLQRIIEVISVKNVSLLFNNRRL